MSRNRNGLRADATTDPSVLPCKHTRSYSVSYNKCLNPIQTRLSVEIQAVGRAAIEARFWAKVNTDGDCWLWTASKMDRQGHGQFVYSLHGKQRHVYAHRIAYELFVESIPDRMVVCHACDVPACVNPSHLFLGTQGDNLRDASRKGRLGGVPRTQKLTYEDRLTIQASMESGAVLARRYGVTRACISVIRRGRFIGAALSGVCRPAEEIHGPQCVRF